MPAEGHQLGRRRRRRLVGGFAAVGGHGYQNTEIGQVIVLAYLDAYTKLLGQLGAFRRGAGGAVRRVAAAMKARLSEPRLFPCGSAAGRRVRPFGGRELRLRFKALGCRR